MIKAEWTNKDTLDLQTTATDCISRQAAIDALDSVFIDDESYKVWFKLAVKNLPSAGPEPKTGKWIEKEICETRRKEEMQVAKCSNCGKYLTTPHFYSFTHYSFCPNCGAKMGNTEKQED